jgi:hypothetical protein
MGNFLGALHSLLYRKGFRERGVSRPCCMVHPDARQMPVFSEDEDIHYMCTECLKEEATLARRRAGRE